MNEQYPPGSSGNPDQHEPPFAAYPHYGRHAQPYYNPAAPYANPMKNALGVCALVLGILTLLFAWVPFLGFGSYLTGGIGLALGLYGYRRVRHGVASNGGVSIAGITLSSLGLASVVLATVVYSAALYAGSQADDTAAVDPTSVVATEEPSGDPTAEPSEPADEPAAKIGDKVRDGDLQFTVTKVTYAKSVGDNPYLEETAKGRYAIVHVKVKNVGSSAATLDDTSQLVFDKKGREFSSDTGANIAMGGTSGASSVWFEEINPGTTVKGKLAFDMPRKAKADRVELHGSLFSMGKTVELS